jgi:hypothetical protein
MNERIHTLAEEAGLYCDGTPDAWDQEAIEKFAELIVKECADIAYVADPYQSGDLILKKFGFDK